MRGPSPPTALFRLVATIQDRHHGSIRAYPPSGAAPRNAPPPKSRAILVYDELDIWRERHRIIEMRDENDVAADVIRIIIYTGIFEDTRNVFPGRLNDIVLNEDRQHAPIKRNL